MIIVNIFTYFFSMARLLLYYITNILYNDGKKTVLSREYLFLKNDPEV